MISTLVYRDQRLAGHNPPVDSLASLRAEPNVMLWIDLSAPTAEEIAAILEQLFAFHPLIIEDCTVDNPFPKLEFYEDHLFLVMHAVDYSKTDKFTTTELDVMLGKNFLVTFHREPLRAVQTVLERYQRLPGTLVRGPDRLAHTLLDQIVEAYKPALHELSDDLESIEEDVLRHVAAEELFPRIVDLRKELAQLRQIVRPQHQIVAELAQGKARLIRPVILPYLRDLAEDLGRIEGQATAWAEQLILSFRVYLNKNSHEANEGIRILTAITALTLPPFILAGWYGMNFRHMPELANGAGYPVVAALMIGATTGMFFLLKKKGWL
ncbi:MAG: magnesium/cobalt transporter CorA [Verrucomicrobiota bacterium]